MVYSLVEEVKEKRLVTPYGASTWEEIDSAADISAEGSETDMN